MNAQALRALQAPLKQRYRENPADALITLHAHASLGNAITCRVESGQARVEAGLHPATGGSGEHACSGDMLLEALAACAGVTMRAVATALEIPLGNGSVHAEGELDFRGTLGVAKDAQVGFRAIRLHFDLETAATPEQVQKLVALTERFCVVYQTLRTPPSFSVSYTLKA